MRPHSVQQSGAFPCFPTVFLPKDMLRMMPACISQHASSSERCPTLQGEPLFAHFTFEDQSPPLVDLFCATLSPLSTLDADRRTGPC